MTTAEKEHFVLRQSIFSRIQSWISLIKFGILDSFNRSAFLQVVNFDHTLWIRKRRNFSTDRPDFAFFVEGSPGEVLCVEYFLFSGVFRCRNFSISFIPYSVKYRCESHLVRTIWPTTIFESPLTFKSVVCLDKIVEIFLVILSRHNEFR